jgi:hypothetical protein
MVYFGTRRGLIVAACFCFFRYLEWSFRYSAIVGLSSRAHETRVASHQSWMFFSMFIALEVCSAFVIGFPSKSRISVLHGSDS